MKRILILVVTAIAFASCQQNGSKVSGSQDVARTSATTSASAAVPASPDAAVMTFEEVNYNFGTIKQGEKVNHDFKFKNTGKTPLIVSSATATCGCTIPETPKDPVAPGNEGVIKVVFNSAGKMGKQDKVITVNSNANPAVNEVHLTGEVTAP